MAARNGSFVAAATELNVTHGAVSKQVQTLERDLGVPLFDRRNRGVHLTHRGKWLAGRLTDIFTDLVGTMHDFHALDHHTPLTISCEPTLCLRLLIPSIAALKHEVGLEVRVLAAGGPIDFRRDHVDVAIRRSDFLVPSNVATIPLAPEWMGPVVTGLGLSYKDSDIPSRLHSATRPDAWRSWQSSNSARRSWGRDIQYEHFYLAIQAAEVGQGAAMASIHMVASDVSAGRLIAPEGFMPDGTEYIALTPSGATNPHATRMIEWLAHKFQSNLELLSVTGPCLDASTAAIEGQTTNYKRQKQA